MLVVEISKRGKLLVGEPFFDFGTPLLLDRKALGDARPGVLAAVARPTRGRARVERVLGDPDDIEAVLEGLLVEQGLREPFEPHDVPEARIDGRVDLRDLPTFTIDPDTAKDFDDAISVRSDGDGLRAWVHIADVAYFVPAGSPLDRGAADRGFSTYVPGTVAPMLPPSLSEDACSLRPHVDRLTVTVEVPFSASLEPGEPLFYRSVIRSDSRLTYGQVQRRELAGEVREHVELAERLAAELRRRRFARGALRIETPEVSFEFDGRGGIARAWLEGEPEAHALVEEFMIMANEAVAALLAGRRREALYRVHERPDPHSILLLIAKLEELDVPTPTAPDAERLGPAQAAELAAAVGERVTAFTRQSGRGREAFPALVLRSLKQARYDPANLGHSGLASVAYCHFTSPIRRYPDLVVHRALLRELGAADDPQPDDLGELAVHASERERDAATLEYRADDLCLAWYLDRLLFESGWESVFDGEISGLIGAGVFVRFGEVFEGFVPVRKIEGDFWELSTMGTSFVGRRTQKRLRLGDPVEVRVEDIRRTEGKVELALTQF